LTTNFIETEENRDIVTGDWRRLNFERWPFNFPIPIEVIDHSDEGESAKGKVLALWNLKDIKL
jgi:hypothetical protein